MLDMILCFKTQNNIFCSFRLLISGEFLTALLFLMFLKGCPDTKLFVKTVCTMYGCGKRASEK